jgi:hypothetical protein
MALLGQTRISQGLRTGLSSQRRRVTGEARRGGGLWETGSKSHSPVGCSTCQHRCGQLRQAVPRAPRPLCRPKNRSLSVRHSALTAPTVWSSPCFFPAPGHLAVHQNTTVRIWRRAAEQRCLTVLVRRIAVQYCFFCGGVWRCAALCTPAAGVSGAPSALNTDVNTTN